MEEKQARAALLRTADEAIAKFELNQIPTYRLDAGSVKQQLKVKTSGEQLRGEVIFSAYISLRLERPHFNIWFKIYKEPHIFAVHYEAGIRKERAGDWIGTQFSTLQDAKAYFFAQIEEAQKSGLLGN